MEFVNRGEDDKVIEFFSNLQSLRVAKQCLIKITQYLEQTSEEERYIKYLNKAEEIGLSNIREIAADYADQNKDGMAIDLCKQAYNNLDKTYLLEELVENNISHTTTDEELLYTIYNRSIEYLKEAFNLAPNDPIIFEKLITNLERLAKHGEVIRLCNKAQIDDIKKADILEKIVDFENYSTEVRQKYMLKVLELDPQTYNSDSNIIHQIVNNFVELEQHNEAIKICDQANISDADKIAILEETGLLGDNYEAS